MRGYTIGFSATAIVGAALLGLAAPAAAQQPVRIEPSKIAPMTEGGQSAAGTEKRICKRYENSASRMKSIRACYTKAEWEKIESDKF